MNIDWNELTALDVYFKCLVFNEMCFPVALSDLSVRFRAPQAVHAPGRPEAEGRREPRSTASRFPGAPGYAVISPDLPPRLC